MFLFDVIFHSKSKIENQQRNPSVNNMKISPKTYHSFHFPGIIFQIMFILLLMKDHLRIKATQSSKKVFFVFFFFHLCCVRRSCSSMCCWEITYCFSYCTCYFLFFFKHNHISSNTQKYVSLISNPIYIYHISLFFVVYHFFFQLYMTCWKLLIFIILIWKFQGKHAWELDWV